MLIYWILKITVQLGLLSWLLSLFLFSGVPCSSFPCYVSFRLSPFHRFPFSFHPLNAALFTKLCF